MQTATSPVSTTAVGGRYGLLTGLVSIILSFGIYVLELEQNSVVRFLTIVVLVGGIVLAMRSFKGQNGGFMGYGQGLSVGLLASGVVGLLSGAFAYLYTSVIDSSVTTRMMDTMRADMEAKGNMSDVQIDQMIAWTSKYTTGPYLLLINFLFVVVIGLLISLIAAAFVKNPKPEFE